MEGFLSKRTSFTRLIQDAALGLFDVVVIVIWIDSLAPKIFKNAERYSARSSAPAFS
jgi:hypothetical protein